MRVLVVDDSEMVRSVLGSMVNRLGHEAVCVGTVADALAADESDVILLDLELPDGTGYEVARTLRARGERARIYAISGHDGVAESCRDAGMNGSLRKPFALDDVATLIGVAGAYIDLGSDEQLLRTMLAGVIDEVPRLLAEARQTNDLSELRRIAHTIRGALRFLDAPRASRAAATLESSVLSGSVSREALSDLENAAEDLIPRLVELLESAYGPSSGS